MSEEQTQAVETVTPKPVVIEGEGQMIFKKKEFKGANEGFFYHVKQYKMDNPEASLAQIQKEIGADKIVAMLNSNLNSVTRGKASTRIPDSNAEREEYRQVNGGCAITVEEALSIIPGEREVSMKTIAARLAKAFAEGDTDAAAKLKVQLLAKLAENEKRAFLGLADDEDEDEEEEGSED